MWAREENSGAGIKPHYVLRHGPVYRLCLRPAAVSAMSPLPLASTASLTLVASAFRMPAGAERLGVSIGGLTTLAQLPQEISQ